MFVKSFDYNYENKIELTIAGEKVDLYLTPGTRNGKLQITASIQADKKVKFKCIDKVRKMREINGNC